MLLLFKWIGVALGKPLFFPQCALSLSLFRHNKHFHARIYRTFSISLTGHSGHFICGVLPWHFTRFESIIYAILCIEDIPLICFNCYPFETDTVTLHIRSMALCLADTNTSKTLVIAFTGVLEITFFTIENRKQSLCTIEVSANEHNVSNRWCPKWCAVDGSITANEYEQKKKWKYKLNSHPNIDFYISHLNFVNKKIKKYEEEFDA